MTSLIATLPWVKSELSPNSRGHWGKKSRITKAYRTDCGFQLRAQGINKIHAGQLTIKITFHPPDKRKRDLDNMIGAFKAGGDAIADVAKVDDSRWAVTYVHGEPRKSGAVVVEIELPFAAAVDVPFVGTIS